MSYIQILVVGILVVSVTASIAYFILEAAKRKREAIDGREPFLKVLGNMGMVTLTSAETELRKMGRKEQKWEILQIYLVLSKEKYVDMWWNKRLRDYSLKPTGKT